jgi:plasmid replication initiation protein
MKGAFYNMANEIVKYNPQLNAVVLRKFTAVEQNLFISMVSRALEKGDEVIRFDFADLKELSKYKMTAKKQFVEDLKRAYQKFFNLRFVQDDGKTYEEWVMFNRFKIDYENEYVDMQIHEMSLPLLNDLSSWTRYSLQEFVELQSSYSKTMFRLLKQYRTGGWFEIDKEKFFTLLDIPDSYKKKEKNVDDRVLKPIKEELSPIFQGLKIIKKFGKGRGKPVVGYRFTWKAEKKDENDFHKGKNYPTDVKKKLRNLEYNGDVSEPEKWRQTDRLTGKQIGTTEVETLPFAISPEGEKVRKKIEKSEKISDNKLIRLTQKQIKEMNIERLRKYRDYGWQRQDEFLKNGLPADHPNFGTYRKIERRTMQILNAIDRKKTTEKGNNA